MNRSNLSECKLSGAMVSYMYGELSSDESIGFEQHLLECSGCTDEFAAISSSRYEVYDWKKLDFDPLETPNFYIPYHEVASTASWSDKIREVIGRAWSIPTISFATVAIITSIAAAGLIWQQNRNVGDLSSNTGPSEVTAPVKVVAPLREEVSSSPEKRPTSGAFDRQDETVIDVTRRPAVEPMPRRIARRDPDVRPAVTRPRRADVKQMTAKNLQSPVPTLNEYADDEEDTSLRLAELLEDIGSR
jgi:hypothetical protein